MSVLYGTGIQSVLVCLGRFPVGAMFNADAFGGLEAGVCLGGRTQSPAKTFGVRGKGTQLPCTKDKAAPVTFTRLMTIVACVPTLLIPGTTGKFGWPFPVVLIVVLLLLLIEALFTLSTHLARSNLKVTRFGETLHRH